MKLKHTRESPERALSERQVNMSNALINAAHSLTLSEKRIMSCAVAKLDSVRAPRHGECPTIRLSAAEYAETFSVTKDTAYDELQSAADNLFQRCIRIIENTWKGPKEFKFRWVGGVKYHNGEGWVELGFWHEVVPHLMMLRKNFTSYKLAQASGLRSVYSWLAGITIAVQGDRSYEEGHRRIHARDGCPRKLPEEFQGSAPPCHRTGGYRTHRERWLANRVDLYLCRTESDGS